LIKSLNTNKKIKKINWIETASLFQKNYYLFDSLTVIYSFKNKINKTFSLSLSNFLNGVSGILFLFFFDAIFDGDEPLWEPLEWSLIQTWLLFIFLFSWIAENLITSQFGSFTGRDKRVWFSWYKSMWWIEIFYVVTLGITILLIITPFYFELTYASSYVMNFWNWFSKVFFFKTVLIFYILILASLILQLQIKNIFFKKNIILIGFITIILFILFFIQFYICFFSYFTDNNWYAKNKSTDLIQLSHEPWKWSWDLENRDHFQYHNSRTVFWFKNDGPFAESFFLINLLYFSSLFIVLIFWISLFKKTISLETISFNFALGVVSTLKQFFFFFLLFYIFVFVCVIIIFLKYPYEFLWVLDSQNILSHFKISVIH
jgi:hypothetical protein